MITFKINGAKHSIPTSWSDLTFAQYVARLSPGFGYTLPEEISLFTGIDIEVLKKATIVNVEAISTALHFRLTPPEKPGDGPSKMIGPFFTPKDITIQSLGQFEDLRTLMHSVPMEIYTSLNTGVDLTREQNIILANAYLEACAIYVQKIKSGTYDSDKVPEVKEELKNYSCMEVIQTGAFFLFKPLNLLRPTTTRSQNIRQRLRKLIQDFPGYLKTLDSLQPSSRKAKE